MTYDSFGDGKLPEGAKGNKPGPRSDRVFDLSKQACNFMEVNKDKPFLSTLPTTLLMVGEFTKFHRGKN